MANFKELLGKANLLDQSPSLSSTNSLIAQVCRELDKKFTTKKVATANVAPIEENISAIEEPVKKKRRRKKKNV